MRHWFSYINTAEKVLADYTGSQPFSAFLKSFFSTDKKYGSKDRKHISHLCYCYFRLGHACKNLSKQERIVAGLFMCATAPDPALAQLNPEWNEKAVLPVEEKLAIINASVQAIFPFINDLSDGIDARAFVISFFTQPNLFLRTRPGKKQIVQNKLDKAGIQYSLERDDCIGLPNSSKIEAILSLHKEVVVQDYSSQRIGDFFSLLKNDLKLDNPSVWDCCAASGGKSILAKDVFKTIDLTVSDIRPSILHNLKTRFNEAGIQSYKCFHADLSAPGKTIPDRTFNLVVCDAPCSGSGTWGRTPEELYYFHQEKIEIFTILQKKITTTVIPSIKAGGYFLYITCSVFKEENEAIAAHCSSAGLQLIEEKILIGYDKKADTMFAALFQKPL